MPCGGVVPIEQHISRDSLDPSNPQHVCWLCHGVRGPIRRALDLFVIECGSYLHHACFGLFLATDVGRVILSHGHMILVPDVPVELSKDYQVQLLTPIPHPAPEVRKLSSGPEPTPTAADRSSSNRPRRRHFSSHRRLQ